MDTEDGAVYIIRDGDESEDGWMSPTPAGRAVADAVAETTDLTADDVDALDSYVDPEDLRAVLDADDDAVAFTVEGHEVTLDSGGNIRVE